MRLVADEGVDREIVDQLRRDGHEVLYVAELDPGVSDQQVLEEANRQDALLLTSDKDFGELVFRQKRIHAGVVLSRLEGLSGPLKAAVLSNLFAVHSSGVVGAFTVISPGRVRIRKAI